MILVTGASGFIASHIVEQLLAKGHQVRGTVRSIKKATAARPNLELVEADLMKPASLDAAAKGCTHVIHAASPYVLNTKDPQTDLVDPAVNGTRNVLEACAMAGTVKRVVLTSSMAAITDEPDNNHLLTESDWNTKSTLARNPYYLSKTLAERAAWEFIAQRKPSFDLVAINPFLVIGPSLIPQLNVSNQIFVDLFKGTYPGIMSLTWGFVDVRDVADAHVRALATGPAKGRYICAGETVSMRKLVDILQRNGYDKLPGIPMDNAIGNLLVRLVSYTKPAGVGTYLRTHVGRVPRYDTTKIRTELGMKFRSAETSIIDTMKDLRKWGHL